MPKIATTTLNQYEYRMVDGFYLRNGFSLVQDKYCTETGLPIFVNKRANGKWGYCDNDGTDFYVEWTFNLLPGPFDHLPSFRPCSEGCGAMLLTTQIVPLCDMCGDYGEEGSTTNESEEEDDEDSEFMCELIDCATCKRPTMRKDMHWTQGGCVMTELCEPCHKAKIPDDMMVVPRYMFENENGEKVKWCLCVMKL